MLSRMNKECKVILERMYSDTEALEEPWEFQKWVTTVTVIRGVYGGRVHVHHCVLSLDYILQFQNPGPSTGTKLTVNSI